MGAAIAGGATFLAGAVGPLVRDLIDRNSADKRDRRTELRAELATYMTALKHHLDTLSGGGNRNEIAESSMAVHLSAERASLLLTAKEEPIVTLMFDALAASSADGIAIRVQATMNTVRAWYRGQIRPKNAQSSFEQHLKEGQAELRRLRVEGSVLTAPLHGER